MRCPILLTLICLLAGAFVLACGEGGGGGLAPGGDTDIDVDTDVDTDSDTDVDTDSDSDTDTDADTDADTDSGSDLDTDTDTDTDSDSDSATGPSCVDDDEDWWCASFDCNDDDPDINPGADEVPDNGIDDDCDGLTDEGGSTDTDVDSDSDTDTDTSTDTTCDDSCEENTPDCESAMVSEAASDLCDGLDNDCDGQVDEGCTCGIGTVQSCFLGPPNFHEVGVCTDGTQTCESSGEFGLWGECTGGIWPTPEVCDYVDNDCDGCVDDDLCCEPAIDCSYDVGDAVPFVDKVIDGTAIYSAPDAILWEWDLTQGPCDEVLGYTSFTMNGSSTTHVEGPTLSTLTLNFTLSGSYTLTLTVHTASETFTCIWVIDVIAPGLRVELCWDTTGPVDVDLHLGKIGTTADWFDFSGTDADCYYSNCKDYSWHDVDWGYPLTSGHYNPRLDIDNILTPGIPENINIDNPLENHEFRVMVHMYDYSAILTHPVVNVYCGGTLKATYGVTPQVNGFDYGCGNDCGDGWKVTDVVWHGDFLSDSCELFPILYLDDYVVESGPFSWP